MSSNKVSLDEYNKTSEKDCMKSQYFGRCCCSCIYQKAIVVHPWNTNPSFKGRVNTIIGWGCNLPELDSTMFFERKHGLCEMHDRKDK